MVSERDKVVGVAVLLWSTIECLEGEECMEVVQPCIEPLNRVRSEILNDTCKGHEMLKAMEMGELLVKAYSGTRGTTSERLLPYWLSGVEMMRSVSDCPTLAGKEEIWKEAVDAVESTMEYIRFAYPQCRSRYEEEIVPILEKGIVVN